MSQSADVEIDTEPIYRWPWQKDRGTPRTARTRNQLSKLRRDNLGASNRYYLMVEEQTVYLWDKATGLEVELPKKDFNRLVDFYNNG